MQIEQFIAQARALLRVLYVNQDNLSQLHALNIAHAELMDASTVSDMERDFVLSKYIAFAEITMYNIPAIKHTLEIVIRQYDVFRGRSSNSETLGPL
jgi:hypothetical protein